MTRTAEIDRKREDWRKTPCPQCGADPGERCKGVAGYRKSVHRARRFSKAEVAAPIIEADDRLESFITGHMAELEQLFRYQIEYAGKRSESPIEKLFTAAVILNSHAASIVGVRLFVFRSAFDREHRASPFECTDVYLQAQVGAYRVDFVFDDLHEGRRRFMAVELDGHDWHERTKAQAARDKKRDRALVTAGFRVLRFTGSEIYAAPGECLQEVIEAIQAARREP
jgi:very-short-patch-repair endonuclease